MAEVLRPAVLRSDVVDVLKPLHLSSHVSELFAELPMLAVVLSADKQPSMPPTPSSSSAGSSQCSQSSRASTPSRMANLGTLQMRASRISTSCAAQRHCLGMGLRSELLKGNHGCECTICQTLSNPGDATPAMTELPCGHTFHKACIDAWMSSNKACPLCRAVPHVQKNPARHRAASAPFRRMHGRGR